MSLVGVGKLVLYLICNYVRDPYNLPKIPLGQVPTPALSMLLCPLLMCKSNIVP